MFVGILNQCYYSNYGLLFLALQETYSVSKYVSKYVIHWAYLFKTSGQPVLSTEISKHRDLRVPQFCFWLCSPTSDDGRELLLESTAGLQLVSYRFLTPVIPPQNQCSDCTSLTPLPPPKQYTSSNVLVLNCMIWKICQKWCVGRLQFTYILLIRQLSFFLTQTELAKVFLICPFSCQIRHICLILPNLPNSLKIQIQLNVSKLTIWNCISFWNTLNVY